jgi:hypothetical protein
MSTYGDLLKAMARLVGGNQPDATNNPYWFSGRDVGDSSGVAGLAGCYWPAPEVIQDTPVALILPVGGKLLQPFPTQGHKQLEDEVHVRVMVGHSDLPTMLTAVADFYDLVPATFDANMQLLNVAPNVIFAANCHPPQVLEVEWGGSAYAALEFPVLIQRNIPVTYSA